MASMVPSDAQRPSGSSWRNLYERAVLELDNSKLRARIASARAAIYDRAEEILTSSPASEERRALHDALRVLEILEHLPTQKNQNATDTSTGSDRVA